MQERRTLVYIKEEDIPASAVAWDGTTLESTYGNTFYIPLYKGNCYGKIGSSSSTMSDVSFPGAYDNRGLTDCLQFYFPTGFNGNRYYQFGDTELEYNENGYPTGYIMSVDARSLYGYNDSGISALSITSAIPLTIFIARYYNLSTPSVISLSPTYLSFKSNGVAQTLDSTAFLPNGYMKIKIIPSDSGNYNGWTYDLCKLKRVTSGRIGKYSYSTTSYGTGWPHPVYVDTE